MLLNAGCDIGKQDSNGNTCLHMLAFYVKYLPETKTVHLMEMFELLRKRARKEHWEIKNAEGLTVLQLTCKEGNMKLFELMLDSDLYKKTVWTFGAITQLSFRLGDLESCVQVIVDNEKVELLTHPTIKKLLGYKWQKFAERNFLMRFIGTMLYLLIFLVVVVINKQDLETDSMWYLNFACEMVVVTGAVWKATKESYEIFRCKTGRWDGIKRYFSKRGSAMIENYCSFGFCSGVLAFTLMRMFSVLPEYDDAVAAVTSLFGWFYLFFFLLGFQTTGHFVVMLAHMLSKDLVIFFSIHAIFLISFTQAFFLIFDDSGISALFHRSSLLMMAILGENDMEEYNNSRYHPLSTFLFIIYIVLSSIMLMNMLIAQMGDTFAAIKGTGELQWELERARIMSAIEDEMSEDDLAKAKKQYASAVVENGSTVLTFAVQVTKADHIYTDVTEHQ